MTPEDLADAGLLFTVDGPVATVTLDRPEVRNAQTPLMWRTLAAIGEQIPDDVRVVLVRGSGQSFSAGLDRAMLDPAGGVEGAETVAALLAKPDDEIFVDHRRLPARLHLAARPALRLDRGGAGLRHRRRLPARARPATCGCSPTTPSCA